MHSSGSKSKGWWVSRDARRAERKRRSACRPMLEQLEERRVRATLPYGATPDDLGEFMLGRVAVTPVFLESNGAVDPNVENWNPAHIQSTMESLTTGLNWWKELLATKSSVHTLDFVIDRTYVDRPSPTVYEPINRPSNDFTLWTQEFLMRVGYARSTLLEENIRDFNEAQRQKLGTDWSFTIFVVNSQVDGEGSFANSGSFSRAFAFPGGLFEVVPSTRPASTFAHETGHIFWARDEYAGGSNYFNQRGYYNTQNTNAFDGNPQVGFVQQPSIMSTGVSLQTAYDQVISPASTLAMIGWQDSDGDGIFDVLDVPLLLDGVGRVDVNSGSYRFVGKAKAQALPNRNSSGLGNDITLNRVSRIEARIADGPWQTIAQPNVYETDLNLNIPLGTTQSGTIQIRAVDQATGITSNVFTGQIAALPDSTPIVGINGFVWNDSNNNGLFDAIESGLGSQVVRLVDNDGNALQLQKAIEPDVMSAGFLPASSYQGVTLLSIGVDTNGNLGVFVDSAASTGSKVFRPYSLGQSGFSDTWNDRRQLKIVFNSSTSFVGVDIIGTSSQSYGRLELYDSAGKLLARKTSKAINVGQVERLELGTDTPNVAYAIVRGHMQTNIKIDNIAYGPRTQATTDSNGRFTFESLPAGAYKLQVQLDNPLTAVSSPIGEFQTVALVSGGVNEHVNFGLFTSNSPWFNSTLPEDVDGDGQVSPIDVLLIVNLLNQNVEAELNGSGLPLNERVDVSNDSFLTAFDALLVINAINNLPPASEAELTSGSGNSSMGSAGGSSSGSSGTASSEGELASENSSFAGALPSQIYGPALPPGFQLPVINASTSVPSSGTPVVGPTSCWFESMAADRQNAESNSASNSTSNSAASGASIDWANLDGEGMTDAEIVAQLTANPWTAPESVPCNCCNCTAVFGKQGLW